MTKLYTIYRKSNSGRNVLIARDVDAKNIGAEIAGSIFGHVSRWVATDAYGKNIARDLRASGATEVEEAPEGLIPSYVIRAQ